MAVEFKDYYATLGLPKTATEKELKAAYRKLARKHHPDVNPGDPSAESKFKELNEAYEVLGDPAKRKKYDELGANWKYYEQAQAAGGGAGSPFGGGFGGGAWNINVGGPGGFRTMTQEEMQEMFGDGDPFSDFFTTFFGGGGGAGGGAQEHRRTHRPRHRTGRDLEQEVELTLEEAFHGATRRVAIQENGQTRTVDVRIPAGVKDGARVRSSGKGEAGANGGSSGDLYLHVRIRPHSSFERKGQDLHTKVAVPLTTAVLGGTVSVPTITGSSLRLTVPELTQNGQLFRMRGHGMPAVGKPAERGDLYATAEIVMPKSLTDQERKMWGELKKLEE